jgi:hypothetical protein
MLCLGLHTTFAWGQLGLTEIECIRVWGTPIQTRDDSPSIRSLTFSNCVYIVEAGLTKGVVNRFVYHTSTFEEQDLQNLLRANAEQRNWLALPARQDTTNRIASREWLRSDDEAMASFDGLAFTAVAAAWRQAQQGSTNDEPQHGSDPSLTSTNPANVPETETEPPPQTQKLAVPVSKVKTKLPAPSILPGKGDSRARVVELIGPPTGTIRMGHREILAYGWGTVMMKGEKVLDVQEGIRRGGTL